MPNVPYLCDEGAATGSARVADILARSAMRRLHGNRDAADMRAAEACAANVLEQLEGRDVLSAEAGGGVGGTDVGQQHASPGQACKGHGYAHHLAPAFEGGAVDEDASRWQNDRDGRGQLFERLGAGCGVA